MKKGNMKILDGCMTDLSRCLDSVVEQLLAFRARIGDFGTLLYCGHDWADAAAMRRSMELMAEEVMPRVNRALGES